MTERPPQMTDGRYETQAEQTTASPQVVSRRRALGAIGTAVVGSLAGCSLGGSPPDVVVFNQRDNEITATVTLVDDQSNELLSKETTIQSDGAFEQDDVLPSDGSVTLRVEVQSGPTAAEAFQLDGNTKSVQARVDSGIKFETV